VLVISVDETTVNDAPMPLNLTHDVVARFVPVIVTSVPMGPPVGENPVMVGGWATVKNARLERVPPGVETAIGPVVAPAGTVAESCVAETTVKPAAAPLNLTAVSPPRWLPVIVSTVPALPLDGVNPEI
jgi:hypothetical protein